MFLLMCNQITSCYGNLTDHSLAEHGDAVIDLSQALRLKDMLNIFDVQQLAANWNSLRSEISANCSNDMRSYFEGLKGGALWAAKSKYPVQL